MPAICTPNKLPTLSLLIISIRPLISAAGTFTLHRLFMNMACSSISPSSAGGGGGSGRDVGRADEVSADRSCVGLDGLAAAAVYL